MFYFISGSLSLLRPSLAVIEAGGIGFKLTVSDRTYDALSPAAAGNKEVKLFTHLAVREDDMELFGFWDEQELETFKLLCRTQGGYGDPFVLHARKVCACRLHRG